MATTRQLVLGVAPDRRLITFYSWDLVDDYNITDDSFSCCYIPEAKTDKINNLQERVFLGTNGVGESCVTFYEGLTRDDSNVFTATAYTSQLDPGKVSQGDPDQRRILQGNTPETRRFVKIEFPRKNPLEDNIDIDFAIDLEDPLTPGAVWYNLTWQTGDSFAYFPDGVARWIALKITDTSDTCGKVSFSSFQLMYYNLGIRYGRCL